MLGGTVRVAGTVLAHRNRAYGLRRCLRLWLGFNLALGLLFRLHHRAASPLYFSEITSCCGISGTCCSVDFAKPAFFAMRSNSANVYASPASVFASMIRLNMAASGGDTRSSLGTNSNMIVFPPGFSALCTRRNIVSHPGGSK